MLSVLARPSRVAFRKPRPQRVDLVLSLKRHEPWDCKSLTRSASPGFARAIVHRGLIVRRFSIQRYCLASDGLHNVFYAPVDGELNRSARVLVVGLTPGFAQMRIAAETYVEYRERYGTIPAYLRELSVPERLSLVR